MNRNKVLIGGLAGGLVANVFESVTNGYLLADRWMAAATAKGFDTSDAAQMTGVMGWVAVTFVFGVVIAWVYAAIRPRFGAGIKTAIIAGLLIWFLSFFYSTFLNTTMGLFDFGLSAKGAIWELGEAVIASIVGAWVYKES